MYKKWLFVTIILLLTAVFATGCMNTNGGEPSPSSAPSSSASTEPSTGTPEPSASPSSSVSPSEDLQKAILDEFQALLKTSGNEKAAIAAIVRDISKLSPENANQMILSFEAYQQEVVTKAAIVGGSLVDLIQKSAPEPYNEKVLNDLSKISDTALKNALQAVFDRGYKIIVPEGMYEAVIDYRVYQNAAAYVTADLAAYIEIMAKESANRMSEDAAIIIPIDEVLARALASESFLQAYPESVKIEQVKLRYTIYVDALFFGQNNTPAFDYFTDKLDQEFIDTYQKAAQSGSDSPIIKVAGEYLKVLEDNNYTLTDAVSAYRNEMTQALKKIAV